MREKSGNISWMLAAAVSGAKLFWKCVCGTNLQTLETSVNFEELTCVLYNTLHRPNLHNELCQFQHYFSHIIIDYSHTRHPTVFELINFEEFSCFKSENSTSSLVSISISRRVPRWLSISSRSSLTRTCISRSTMLVNNIKFHLKSDLRLNYRRWWLLFTWYSLSSFNKCNVENECPTEISRIRCANIG